MRIYYIARDAGIECNGAGTVMSRNLKALQNIAGEGNVNVFILPPSNIKNVLSSVSSLSSYGVPKYIELEVVKKANAFNPDVIFVDSTSFGSLVKRLEKVAPVIAFAHNLDTKLCREEIGSRPFWITIPKYLMTKYNETKTTKYASHLICLNERDSIDFKNTFNREADIILPITFPSKDLSAYDTLKPPPRHYYLFVGSDFFPNVEGIYWFTENVAPYVNADFHIVGSCCRSEKVRCQHLPANVKLLGYIDDLDNEYYNASGVIAPIFKGSGMKTKTIEALSYAKSIFGTVEAFAGIETNHHLIGGLCNTAEAFIKELNGYNGELFNPYSLELFNELFSDRIAITKLSNLIKAFNCI